MMKQRPWHKRGYSIADSSCVIGGYCEIAGRPYIVSDAGNLIEVLPDRVESELGIKDMDGVPLYENDYIQDVNTNEVYRLQYNPEFPFSAIHPFSFRVNAQTQQLEKHRKVQNIA